MARRATEYLGDLGVAHPVEVVIDRGTRLVIGELGECGADQDARFEWAWIELGRPRPDVLVKKAHAIAMIAQARETRIRRYRVEERARRTRAAKLLGPRHDPGEDLVQDIVCVRFAAEDRARSAQHAVTVTPVQRPDVEAATAHALDPERMWHAVDQLDDRAILDDARIEQRVELAGRRIELVVAGAAALAEDARPIERHAVVRQRGEAIEPQLPLGFAQARDGVE